MDQLPNQSIRLYIFNCRKRWDRVEHARRLAMNEVTEDDRMADNDNEDRETNEVDMTEIKKGKSPKIDRHRSTNPYRYRVSGGATGFA